MLVSWGAGLLLEAVGSVQSKPFQQHTRPPHILAAAAPADSAPPKTGHLCAHSTPTQPQLLPRHRQGARSRRPAVPPCLQTGIFLPSGPPNASFRLSASACPSPAGTAAPGEAPVSPAPRCTRANAHVHPSLPLPSWAAATFFFSLHPRYIHLLFGEKDCRGSDARLAHDALLLAPPRAAADGFVPIPGLCTTHSNRYYLAKKGS